MRYAISVLVRPEAEAEAGDVSSELWFSGTAEVPAGLAPSAVLFPGEGEVALFPIEVPAPVEEPPAPEAVPEAAEPTEAKAKKGK